MSSNPDLCLRQTQVVGPLGEFLRPVLYWSRKGSNSRMIIEMSAGNLAMMVRRKTHLPRSHLLNQMLTANCVVTSAVRGWGRNEVLRVDFAAFNQQADNGDVH
ncbi:unnamed protein product [Caretta caretta]